MQWASSISSDDNIESCIQKTCADIKSQLGDKMADLTIVFVSPHYQKEYPNIPALIRREMEPGILFGCSGGGIIGGGSEVENNPAFSITVAHLPGVDIKTIYSDTTTLPDQDTGPRIWREWIGVDVESDPQFIFLADPFSFRGEDFLAGVDFAYPNSRKVGGLASGAQSLGGNVLYLEDKIYDKGLIGLALSGNVQLDTIVAQGCRPIGQPMKITACDQNLLSGLDNQPPMEILQELHSTLGESDQKLMQTSLFLGIEMDPFKEDPGQGDFLIRNLMGADRGNGAISIGAYLREGQLVQFHLRDKVMSAEDLDVMLMRYHDQDKHGDARGALLYLQSKCQRQSRAPPHSSRCIPPEAWWWNYGRENWGRPGLRELYRFRSPSPSDLKGRHRDQP